MIKFDLHIHSIASKYKEGPGIVDASTPENAEVLLAKLSENQVSLFSITDHNRFNIDLYCRLDELISSGTYPYVHGLVAGVEFDVQLDPEMQKCHIVTIFDAKNSRDNYRKIHDVIEAHRLDDKDAAYDKKAYEVLLREIGLDVILIACQRNSLDRHDGHHNSLSESTREAQELLLAGYINALEFQRPNVEGILKDNLRKMPRQVMLVMGSDCHEWSAYPDHDHVNRNRQFSHSKANILPTFKGLLMAVTSPETRINQPENRNINFIESISIRGVNYPLTNGLNAIIGENGSGKSTLLKVMHGDTRQPFVSNLKTKNAIECDSGESDKRLFIEQGQIVEKFGKNNLFPQDHFLPIDHGPFRNAYSTYALGILTYIKNRIASKESLLLLSKESIQYNELIHEGRYFIHIERDSDFGEIDNPHSVHNEEMTNLLNLVTTFRADEYYGEFYNDLDQIIHLIIRIYRKVHADFEDTLTEQKVKNYIISAIAGYNEDVNTAATSKEREQRDFREARRDFIGHLIDAVKKNTSYNPFPNAPTPVFGCSSNPKCGFSFNSEAAYHGRDVLNDFLSRMFTKAYASIDALKVIETTDELVSAVKGCTDSNQVDTVFQRNLTAFLEELCECKNYIVDTTQDNEELGNTLGELSLAYFKYMTEHEVERCIFLIDQPEDHISNNNISKKLIKYFNSIRTRRQIIMVTHNPLLVVNQDVDNVIFIRKSGERIEAVSGCLELENENVNILDIIAQNMDGGKDSIEKRLRVYGKENHSGNAGF